MLDLYLNLISTIRLINKTMFARKKEDEEISKLNLYFYSAFLLIGAINLGYFISQCLLFLSLDKPLILVLGYFGVVAGSIIAGVFPRTSKRKKKMLGNVLVMICNVISILFYNNMTLICALNIITGIGIGIISICVPFYLREIVPEEYKKRIIVFFGIFYFIGIQINSITCWIIISLDTLSYLWVLFCVPLVFIGSQVFLQLTFFKHDTPSYYFEDKQEETSLLALQKIYTANERRLKEFDKLKTITTEYKIKYPTYKEIFQGEYLTLFLKGALLTTIRNAGENFILLGITKEEQEKGHFVKYLIIMSVIITGAGFILSKLTSKRKLILAYTASSIVILTYTIMDFIHLYAPFHEYYFITENLVIIEWMVHDMITSPVVFMYMICILPERGFTLLISLHWITATAINCPFYYIEDNLTMVVWFDVFFLVCSLSGLFFSWFMFKESDMTKEVDRPNSIN